MSNYLSKVTDMAYLATSYVAIGVFMFVVCMYSVLRELREKKLHTYYGAGMVAAAIVGFLWILSLPTLIILNRRKK
jgi:surface polysaccharide O-acyltransferase-like enzyme